MYLQPCHGEIKIIIMRPFPEAALSVAPRPSVRPSLASYFLEIGKS